MAPAHHRRPQGGGLGIATLVGAAETLRRDAVTNIRARADGEGADGAGPRQAGDLVLCAAWHGSSRRNPKLLYLRRRAMVHFRPVFTLLAVISTVGVQVSTCSCPDEDHHRVCGGESKDHPAIHRPGAGNFREVRPRCEDCALSRRADAGREPRFRRNEVGYTGGTSVVGAAGQGNYLRILSSISSTLTHSMMAISASNGSRSCAGSASAFRTWAAALGCIPCWHWSMSASNRSATISIS